MSIGLKRSNSAVGFSIAVAMLISFAALKAPPDARAASEHAVIAVISLKSGDMGSADERDRIVALERQLSSAIAQSKAGELDGDEFGGGVCTIYLYGPSAERLSEVVLPILRSFRPPAGSYVIKRYGKPGSKEDRISIAE